MRLNPVFLFPQTSLVVNIDLSFTQVLDFPRIFQVIDHGRDKLSSPSIATSLHCVFHMIVARPVREMRVQLGADEKALPPDQCVTALILVRASRALAHNQLHSVPARMQNFVHFCQQTNKSWLSLWTHSKTPGLSLGSTVKTAFAVTSG